MRFRDTHRQYHFEAIREACGGERRFPRESITSYIGTTISRKRAGNENAVDHFEKLAVEDPVWEILCPVLEDRGFRSKYQCAGLRFSNNRLDVAAPSSGSWGMQEGRGEEGLGRRRRTGSSKWAASESRGKPPPTRPDGWGVRTHLNKDESRAFVYDYKAAHKIAAGSVRSAVSKETLFMEVVLRVNSSRTQNDGEGGGQERMEDLIAIALAQVFDYMVRNGVAYGYVAAGKSLLLLHVDRSDLETLYCHACVPEEDVGHPSDEDWASDNVAYTAVAQLASFCLLTLHSDALRGALLDEASRTAEAMLQTWPEPYEDAGHILSSQDTDPPSASSSQATDANFISSAGATGRAVGLRSRSSCRTMDIVAGDDEDDDARPDEGPPGPQAPVGSRKRKNGPSSGSSGEEDAKISESLPTRPYCTQQCLLGLKKGRALDHKCPNVDLHGTARGGSHPIKGQEFARLVGQQLRQDPYRKCDALDRQRKWGSVGVLFKLELEPYGYTFVGKGALSGHPSDLVHEGCVYARLDALRGRAVPVYLGMVSLNRGHAIPGEIWIYNMMLMSWAGEKAADTKAPNLAAETERCLKAVAAEGVEQRDERDDNLLWNQERGCVMLIDFDRAVLAPSPPNRPLLKIAGTKRNRSGYESGPPRKRAPLRGAGR